MFAGIRCAWTISRPQEEQGPFRRLVKRLRWSQQQTGIRLLPMP